MFKRTNKKKGFTLLEVMISIAIISIVSVSLFKLTTNFKENMHAMSIRSEEIKLEYQDVLLVRASDKTDSVDELKETLNFRSRFTKERDGNSERQVWRYEGKYMETYKMYD